MAENGIVYLVDDEAEMVKALTRLLRYQHLEVRGYTSARTFLAELDPHALGCLVLDVSMPELSGLDLQHELGLRGSRLPIIFLTGHGDIPMSVRAMKAGAYEFLTKPVDQTVLVQAIQGALAQAEAKRQEAVNTDDLMKRIALLTPREKDVLQRVVAGRLNKQIAAELGTGLQNIKFHRANMMRKLDVSSVAGFVRALERAQPPQ